MSRKTTLKQIEKQIISCKKCGLCKTAERSVPGEGNINAEIVFIGEAPGANEDKTGRPFVGRSGQLLEKELENIGMTRESVWIGNIIKHRPPKNRDPKPDEIASCQPYLSSQLKVIKPMLIVTLGRFALNHFDKQCTITNDHGTLKKVGDYYIYPIYHPAAALRNGNFAKVLHADFAKIPKVIKFIEMQESKEDADQFSTSWNF